MRFCAKIAAYSWAICHNVSKSSYGNSWHYTAIWQMADGSGIWLHLWCATMPEMETDDPDL